MYSKELPSSVEPIIKYAPLSSIGINSFLVKLKRKIDPKTTNIINPDIIILLGNVAAKAILKNNEGITKIHGNWFNYKNPYLKKIISYPNTTNVLNPVTGGEIKINC